MAKASVIQKLISALSKAEKRYFRLSASLQQGNKDYVLLFDLFLKYKNANDIKAAFKKHRPKSSYEIAGKHLYKVLMQTLLQLRMHQGRNTSLIIRLLKVNILFEKCLYEEGFSELHKIQSLAKRHEEYIIELWATRTELYYLSNLNFHAITENGLIKKQRSLQESMRYISNIQQHKSLYELLRHRLVYKGNVRTAAQKKELDDLVVTEMNIISNPLANTFESEKTHLLFQANYFIAINDYKSALKTFYELNKLLEEHYYLWADEPLVYLYAIEGILNSLHTIHEYNGMNYFFTRLENMQKHSAYFEVMVNKVIYIYKLNALLNNGNFAKAISLKDQFEESLLAKTDVLDADKRAEVYLYTALIYFVNNDIHTAHTYLNNVLQQSNEYYNLPVYQTFRLMHLLVQYELGNHDLVQHEIRAVKRKFAGNQRKTYKIEKIVFSFLTEATLTAKQGGEVWPKYKTMLNTIAKDKYEIQILKIFDFAGWIEARLTRKPFDKILKAKNQQEANLK